MDHADAMSALFAMRSSKEIYVAPILEKNDMQEDSYVVTGGGGEFDNSLSNSGNVEDRLQRSRERNRMHARKTRQRKKLQMQTLQLRANELKLEQQRLKQIINDRKTANILLDICSPSPMNKEEGKKEVEVVIPVDVKFDADVEKILKRPNSDIPDGKRIMKETAALVPSHKAKTIRSMSLGGEDVLDDFDTVEPDNDLPSSDSAALTLNGKFPDDGIDYALLSRDRNKCTPAELDQIRRERNRMHAKRTRDRKKIFVEEMDNVIKVLDAENLKLRALIEQYYPQNTFSMSTQPAGALPPPTEQFYIGQRNPGQKSSSSSSASNSNRLKGVEGNPGSSKSASAAVAPAPRPTHGKTTRRNTPAPVAVVIPEKNSTSGASASKAGATNPAKRHKPNTQESDSNSDFDTMTFDGSSENGGSESGYGVTVSESNPDSSVTQSSKGSMKGSSTNGSSNSSSSSSVASGDE